VDNKAKTFDALDIKDFALEGEYSASGISIGPDGKIEELVNAVVKPSFQLLIEHVKGFTPEWASSICDVPSSTIRRITREFVENAMVGATITIEGVEIPYRPTAIMLGRDINNGWGALQCVWAKHVLEMLVGAIEVAGSDLGCYVLFSGPVAKTDDGFFEYPFNPTDKTRWQFPPGQRDGIPSLSPLCSSFHGSGHLAWKWLLEAPKNWPKPSIPDVLITYKVNALVSQFDTPVVIEVLKSVPFHAAFVNTMDETAWFADLLLPEDSDLESLQIFPVGGTKERENFWEYWGFAIKQPVVKRAFNTMDCTDIATELADRIGMLADYNEAINQGAFLGRRLKGTPYELEPNKKYRAEELYDRFCKVTTINKEEHDLEWFKQNGGLFEPFPKIGEGITLGRFYIRPWYLYPLMRQQKMRFELPYQERVKRIGEELRERLYENGIRWWDRQLDEYNALPKWEDISIYLDEVTIKRFGKKPEDYPLWLLVTKSMQYAWSGNIGIALMHEAAGHVLGHTWIQMNRKTGESLGIKDKDEVWIESPYWKMKGRVKVRDGIRPDCVLTTQAYGQWATPFAKDFGIPNVNQIAPALIELTDESGGSKNHVKVRVYRA
jgi:phenylacetyl-CoA:acceptor oxidoreductase